MAFLVRMRPLITTMIYNLTKINSFWWFRNIQK